MLTTIVMYVAVGCVAGLLAGLLGVGGGLIIVPMLLFCFGRQGVPDEVMMRLALGTSMATIVFTSVSSFMAHHRRGAVHWLVVRRVVLGIFLGTFLGTYVVSRVPTSFLKNFFALFLCYVATQMLLDRKPKPSRELPGRWGLSAVGVGIGFVSSLVGVGGGMLSVPFMVWCNLPLHRAIGTSAAIGFPIAISGALGYIYNGFHAPQLPSASVGYVNLPALACIASASVLFAPLGVRLAHRLPVARLKKAFALFLALVALRMLVTSLWPLVVSRV